MTTLIRSTELTPGSGREIYGRAVPYDVVIKVPDDDYSCWIREKFVPGSFARSIKERGHKVKLLTSHDRRKLAVGRAVDLREEIDGLHASFEVAKTRDGDELLELVRSGVVDCFSIGFEPVRNHREHDRKNGDLVTRLEAKLVEVSAVNFPSYEDALIGGVRSQSSLVIPRAVAAARFELMDW